MYHNIYCSVVEGLELRIGFFPYSHPLLSLGFITKLLGLRTHSYGLVRGAGDPVL